MEVKVQSIVVAVLPFINSTQDPNIDYFVSGFTEDLIVDLSKFSALQVISSLSTANLVAQSEEEENSIRSLNADYLVKGNCRLKADNIRLNVQLVATSDNTVLWAERYDEDRSQLFDIQDDIIERIANAIQTGIDINILLESRTKDKGSLQAYDCWLRGMEQLKLGTLENDESARAYFEQALASAPNYSRAFTGLSLSYFNEWSCQIWERWDVSKKGAFEYAQKAIQVNDHDYIAHSVVGQIHLFNAAYEKAEYHLRKSLQLNTNDAGNLCRVATNFCFLGYLEEAEALYLKAIRLNPIRKQSFFPTGGLVYFELGQFEKCIEIWNQVNLEMGWVDLPAYLSAAYFRLENFDKSRHYWDIFEKQFKERILFGKTAKLNQGAQWLININPYRRESNIRTFLEYITNQNLSQRRQMPDFSSVGTPDVNIFRKGAGLWEICYDHKTVLLPPVKGYKDIARLLARPNQPIHCSELMGSTVQYQEEVLVMDDKAKQSYKKRLQELTIDLEEAELRNDIAQTSVLRKEYDELVDHLSKSLGLGGKTRKLNSNTERERSAITWRLRSAIKKIKEAHPKLGAHFAKAIETGTFCAYAPEQMVAWKLN